MNLYKLLLPESPVQGQGVLTSSQMRSTKVGAAVDTLAAVPRSLLPSGLLDHLGKEVLGRFPLPACSDPPQWLRTLSYG